MKQSLIPSIPSFFGVLATLTGLSVGSFAANAQEPEAPSINLPGSAGDDHSQHMNLTPDGRIIVVDSSGTISLETESGSGEFQTLGQLPDGDISSFGASFIAVSPNSELLAVGNNGGLNFDNPQVGVFDLNNVQEGRWLDGLNFSGVWWDNQYLLITAGSFGEPSQVVVLDTQSPLASAPSRTPIVSGIGGASAGIMLDVQDNLWTGNGYATSGPSKAGAVHRIDRQAWQAAFNAERDPVNFETQATPVARALSASSIAIDARGNLWVGGAVTFGAEQETGFAALFLADKVRAVIAGERAPLDSRNEADLIKVDTDPDIPGQSYNVYASLDGRDILLRESSTPKVYVASPAPGTPAPVLGGLGGLAILGFGLGAGLAARTRRA